MVSDQVQWVRIGPRMPPLALRSSPTTTPSSRAAKVSITLPVAAVATTYATVVQSTGWTVIAAYAAPRKNSSSATPLTAVTSTSSGNEPWSA